MPRIVLFDADVISHFIATDKLSLLPAICRPHRIIIFDAVYIEIILKDGRKEIIDNFMEQNEIETTPFPADNIDINREFAFIKTYKPLIGDGERALMAHARFSDDVIASSNFRDVAAYCQQNDIDFLGTLDILAIARKKGILSELECNNFIREAKVKNKAKFPLGVEKISDYPCTKICLLD